MERNTLLALKGWLGVGRGGGGGGGWRKKQAGVVTIPPFLFVSLIMFGFVYLLFVFITYRFSCGTILFSAGIYFFFRAYPIEVSHS